MRMPALSLLLALAAGPAIGRGARPPAATSSCRSRPARCGSTPRRARCRSAPARAGELACRCCPTRRAQATADDAALQERIAALEARIAALEARAARGDALADEEAMDRVMVLADRMMRQFFGLVREMKRDMESDEL